MGACGPVGIQGGGEEGGRDYVSLRTPSTVVTISYNFHQQTSNSYHHEQDHQTCVVQAGASGSRGSLRWVIACGSPWLLGGWLLVVPRGCLG